jgi:hypothetical protein
MLLSGQVGKEDHGISHRIPPLAVLSTALGDAPLYPFRLSDNEVPQPSCGPALADIQDDYIPSVGLRLVDAAETTFYRSDMVVSSTLLPSRRSIISASLTKVASFQ